MIDYLAGNVTIDLADKAGKATRPLLEAKLMDQLEAFQTTLREAFPGLRSWIVLAYRLPEVTWGLSTRTWPPDAPPFTRS